MGKFITREFHKGAPIQAGNFILVPFSQVVRLQIPGSVLGLIWNRPSSILVRSTDGQEYLAPVRDKTRRVQIALICGAFLTSLFYFLTMRLSQRV
ncbi:MAG: hypothetical protein P8Z00_13080 [Anaerolineales bacterium]